MKLIALSLLAGTVWAADNPLSNELRATYGVVRGNLIRMAEKMPEEHYSFKPVDGLETFGGRVLHIAQGNYRVCTALAGEQKSLSAKATDSKAQLVAAIRESFAACDKIVEPMDDVKALELAGAFGGPPLPAGTQRTRLSTLHNLVRHSNEVYGNMSVYMRLKGVVPPTSE